MDSITAAQIESWLSTFIKKISLKWSIDKIILFGSRSNGSSLIHSDIDLLIISQDFKRLNFRERRLMLIQEWEGYVDIELICLTPEEFQIKKSQIGIVNEIVQTGKELPIHNSDNP